MMSAEGGICETAAKFRLQLVRQEVEDFEKKQQQQQQQKKTKAFNVKHIHLVFCLNGIEERVVYAGSW